MRTKVPAQLPIFRSDGQLGLLGLLLLNPETTHTSAELGEACGLPSASVHRELQRAVASGVVVRDDHARPHRYSAASESPLFEPLAALLDRTVGVEARLRVALERAPGVQAAAIHGSWAAGAMQPDSDVDLLVVGTADGPELRRKLRHLGHEVGRRIDLTLMSPEELRNRLAHQDGFAVRLVEGPVKPLVGEVRPPLDDD